MNYNRFFSRTNVTVTFEFESMEFMIRIETEMPLNLYEKTSGNRIKQNEINKHKCEYSFGVDPPPTVRTLPNDDEILCIASFQSHHSRVLCAVCCAGLCDSNVRSLYRKISKATMNLKTEGNISSIVSIPLTMRLHIECAR